MTRTDHRGAGNYNKNHTKPKSEGSSIDRKQFNKDRRGYWKSEDESGRWEDFPDD